MTNRIEVAGLRVAGELFTFVAEEALAGTGIAEVDFWRRFSDIIHDLAPKNQALLAKRVALQAELDGWYRTHGAPSDMDAYKNFLKEIGYLLPEGPDFAVAAQNVDPEIALVAGPQLVVPVMNARYALNAANARWGSLYDALYGTDAIPETDHAGKGSTYNPKRGQKVISWARGFLDTSVPLATGSWSDITGLTVKNGVLTTSLGGLNAPEQFLGFNGPAQQPNAVVFANNGLHIEIRFDRAKGTRAAG